MQLYVRIADGKIRETATAAAPPGADWLPTVCDPTPEGVANFTVVPGTPVIHADHVRFTWQLVPVASRSHRVLKTTIWHRVETAGKIEQMAALIGSLPARDRIEWDAKDFFLNDSPRIVGALTALGLDPVVILAPDPLAP